MSSEPGLKDIPSRVMKTGLQMPCANPFVVDMVDATSLYVHFTCGRCGESFASDTDRRIHRLEGRCSD